MFERIASKKDKRGYGYWIVVAILLVYLCLKLSEYPYTYALDIWEHTASLKELSADITSPKNPFVISESTSSRYMPYLLLLAFVKRLTGLDVFWTMQVGTILNFLLCVIGLRLFIREYFRDDHQPLYTLVVMLFMWGAGYYWSNAYSLHVLPTVLCYPSFFSFALSYFSFYYILKALKYGGIRYYLYTVLLGSAAFLSHPLTGGFYFISAFFLIVCERHVATREQVKAVVVLFLAFVLSFFWPYFSMFALFFDSAPSSGGYHLRPHFYSVPAILERVGPGLLGFFFVYHYLVRRRYRFVTYSFVALFGMYILSVFFPVPLGWRFLFFAIVYLHLATSRKMRELNIFSIKTLKNSLYCYDNARLFTSMMAVILALSILYNIKIAEPTSAFRGSTPKGQQFLDKFSFLDESVGPYDVVMSDIHTSWIIPSFSGKVTSFLRSNPLLRDREERLRDNEMFFSEDASEDTRRELLQKYDVRYVLLNRDYVDDKLVAMIELLGEKIHDEDGVILIKIR
jgi:hypothetical protein